MSSPADSNGLASIAHAASERRPERPHISVCITTFRRPVLLDRCIDALHAQEAGEFTYSIVVVDNDEQESAREVAIRWQSNSPLSIVYDVEPVPNISNARNRAIRNAVGDLIAFIDDDECPEPRWLPELAAAQSKYGLDGVLGPVLPAYEGNPPRWLVQSGLCVRKTYPTGTVLGSVGDLRTGNVLFVRRIIADDERPFDPRFGRTGGEDSEFFGRKLREGRSFVWCNEARVHESVPVDRQTLRFYVRRALVLGSTASARERILSIGTVKSVIAVILYTSSLPFILVLGYPRFVNVLIRDLNHAAKLLAHLGVPRSRERVS